MKNEKEKEKEKKKTKGKLIMYFLHYMKA